MHILVSGSSGLVGSALVAHLITQGHQVIRLIRQPDQAGTRFWDPETGTLSPEVFEGIEAVIHLGGENVASGKWTAEKKEKLRTSRVQSTQLLSDTLASLDQPPPLFLCASAIGFYGNRGDEDLDEFSPPGTDFLASICTDWEKATEPARQKGIRVANMRIGVVLSKKGGALKRMLPPFQSGLGGPIGDGRQYISWIALDDVVYAIEHILNTTDYTGPVNLVAPNPVRNKEFTQTLARVLNRPALFPVPKTMIKLMFGEMGETLLLSSTKVHPRQLQNQGYTFRYPVLESALRHVLRMPG